MGEQDQQGLRVGMGASEFCGLTLSPTYTSWAAKLAPRGHCKLVQENMLRVLLILRGQSQGTRIRGALGEGGAPRARGAAGQAGGAHCGLRGRGEGGSLAVGLR